MKPARYQQRITFKQKGENSTSYRNMIMGNVKHNKNTFQESTTRHINMHHMPLIKIHMFMSYNIAHSILSDQTGFTYSHIYTYIINTYKFTFISHVFQITYITFITQQQFISNESSNSLITFYTHITIT